MNALPDGPQRPVTLRDIAAAAGVSATTVSHVVNEKPGVRIGHDTRERVHAVVRQLGYRPNTMAKNLVTGGSRFLGLIADAIATTPFAGQIIHGAQDEAWRQGYVLLIANTEGDEAAETEAITMMLGHQVRGILYSTWYHRAVQPPEALRETDYVLVNCFAPDRTDARAVVPDEVAGGRDAAQMLLEAGHRRIGFINTTTPSPARSGRLAGYKQALTEAGVAFDPSLVVDARSDQTGGYAALGQLLDAGVTGVFCHNDRVAMGAYDALRERGVDVPGEFSVVGFDNQEVIAAFLRPPLTTVALPHYELGRLSVRVLLGLDRVRDVHPLLVDCPRVLRSSCAARSPAHA